MTYDTLAKKLGLRPIVIAIMFREGLEKQYRHKVKVSRRQPLRSGRMRKKMRMVIAPKLRLKAIQRRIADLLTREFIAHPIAHGYVVGRSIATNASIHIGAKLLLHLDLVDYFGSIDQSAVAEALRRELTDLDDTDIGFLADLCCYKGFLPQGSPASPILSNMVCYLFDAQLDALAKSCGCKVSRLSDDICVSTTADHFPPEILLVWDPADPQGVMLGSCLFSIIDGYGFEINWEKLKIQAIGGRMQVTGAHVGESSISVPREFRDNIRAALHCWGRDGLMICARRQHRAGCTRAFVNVLRGGIAHVGNIEGADSPRFQRFLQAFRALLDRDRSHLCPMIDNAHQVCTHSRSRDAR